MADEQQPVPLFPDNLIDVESRVGAGLRKRPQSILPALNRGSTRKAEELLLNVLLGASGGISAAQKAGGAPPDDAPEAPTRARRPAAPRGRRPATGR